MCAGHRARCKLVHNLRSADDRRKRQRTGDPFTAADEVRNDAIVFEAPEFAGSAESSLDFIEDENDLVLVAPISQVPNVIDRREVRSDALIGFHHDAGDLVRLETGAGDCIDEGVKAGVLLPVTVGEGSVNDGRVKINDPGLLSRHAAGLLRTESAAMETAFETNKADLFLTTGFDALGAGQLERALGGLRTGGQQKDLVQAGWSQARQTFNQRGSLLARKAVIVQKPTLDLVDDGLLDLRCAMAGIRNQDARTPVEPTIAVFVVNKDVLRAFPNQGRLAAHRLRLELP